MDFLLDTTRFLHVVHTLPPWLTGRAASGRSSGVAPLGRLRWGMWCRQSTWPFLVFSLQVYGVYGWLGTCFADMTHMAHCCDQPERCFGEGKDLQESGVEECCGLKVQRALLQSVARDLRAAEEVAHLREIYSVLQAFCHFVNFGDISAWELLAQAAGKVALAEYNDFALRAPELGSESYRSRRLFLMREINHAAHLLENFFQAAWYHHAMETGRSAMETDISEVRPKFQNAMIIYEVVQDAADFLLYDFESQLAVQNPRWIPIMAAPEIVLVVNVIGSWASVGFVTFWSILRHRSTPLRVFVLGDQEGQGIVLSCFVPVVYHLLGVNRSQQYIFMIEGKRSMSCFPVFHVFLRV